LPGLWFSAEQIHALMTMNALLHGLDPGGFIGGEVGPLIQRLDRPLSRANAPARDVLPRVRIVGNMGRLVQLKGFQTVGAAQCRAQRRDLLSHYFPALRQVAVHRQRWLRRLQQLRSLAEQRIDRRVVRHAERCQKLGQGPCTGPLIVSEHIPVWFVRAISRAPAVTERVMLACTASPRFARNAWSGRRSSGAIRRCSPGCRRSKRSVNPRANGGLQATSTCRSCSGSWLALVSSSALITGTPHWIDA
jgi:hypothetical protein